MTTRQFFCFTIHFQFEYITVRDSVIQGNKRARARYILEIDDFLFRFTQCVRFKVAHLFEVITVITRNTHQTLCVRLVQILPPQAEEQGAVLHLRRELLHPRHIRLRGLILRVG